MRNMDPTLRVLSDLHTRLTNMDERLSKLQDHLERLIKSGLTEAQYNVVLDCLNELEGM